MSIPLNESPGFKRPNTRQTRGPYLVKDENREKRRLRRMTMLVAGVPDPLEQILGLLKIVFGSWMIVVHSVFATAPALYRYLAWQPDWVYGILFLALGLGQWIALDRDVPRARFFVGILAAMLWDYWGLMVFRADHRAPALAFLSVIAVGQLAAVAWLYDRAFPRKTL